MTEAARDRVGGVLHGGAQGVLGGNFVFDAGYATVGDAAGDDPVEVAQISGDVECEAVRGDGLRDVDADGGDLFFLHGGVWRGSGHRPYAGALADALREDAEVVAGANDGFFHEADEVDGAEVRALFAGEIAAQIEDGVADELSGTVVGDISAAIDLVYLDALCGEEFITREDIGAGGVAAEGKDGGMLQQDERVSDALCLARGDDLVHDADAFCVGDAAELEEVDDHSIATC